MTSSPKRDRGLVSVFVLGVLLAAGGGLGIYFLVTDDSVESLGPSMKPTLQGRETLEIDTGAYEGSPPGLNDVVAAQGPEGLDFEVCADAATGSPCPRASASYSKIRIVKRVVGLPGDSIAFTPDGETIRNSQRADEPFIRPCAGECGLPEAIVVPDGYYFLAGDNRPVSSDSRFWGAVPAEAIDGRVVLP